MRDRNDERHRRRAATEAIEDRVRVQVEQEQHERSAVLAFERQQSELEQFYIAKRAFLGMAGDPVAKTWVVRYREGGGALTAGDDLRLDLGAAMTAENAWLLARAMNREWRLGGLFLPFNTQTGDAHWIQ